MLKKVVTFVYDPVCPFAQRVWLTLLEKGIPFDTMKINLRNKPQQFIDIYSKAYGRDPDSNGKVPLVIHNERILTESDLISWYLSEQFHTGSPLIPMDSFQRLKMRWFIQNVVPKFVSAFYSFSRFESKTEQEQNKIRNNINDTLQKMEDSIQGPYVLGENISLADLFVYPWLERWCVQEALFGICIPKGLKKIQGLKAAVEKRPSVAETKKETSPQFFIESYTSYFRGQP